MRSYWGTGRDGLSDGMAMILPMFEQAERVQQGKRIKDAQIDAVFAKWVDPAN
ncbi:hypothetical protein K6978_03380 [Xanthomonas cucurbitae]|uniref:HpaB/PvcC/4-BUDH C-terminal domain-containing protein n=1 Tax=Xanthomonas cucurbitae TaxID=56453 RepID=A0ABY7YJI8_9XANT|nr:hypothetical protein [Xanthomonas cucurbitae]WDM73782.1 hypothetical protein K6978_03380 [Xanthomonas cucurbitae]